MNQPKKLVVVACIGTILEWAEFTFYAYIAAMISTLFFPNMNHQMGIVAAFVIFAIGYLMRPLGAILFGHLGDRLGRRTALQASIMLMGVSAVCIGLLPTYQTIGSLAPVLLLFFRCLQGLAVSGEYNGSSIFLMEHEKGSHLYLAASWTGWAASIGMMLGSVAALIVSLPGVADWAWRTPFLSGAFICLCGYFIRRKFAETPEFLDLLPSQAIKRFPLSDVLRKHYKSFFATSMLAAVLGIYIYVANVFYTTHLISVAEFQPYQAKLIVSVGALLTVLLFPWVAKLADHRGGREVMYIGLCLVILVGPALYGVSMMHSVALAVLVQIPSALAGTMLFAPAYRMVNELFPVSIRYTGVSFSWNLSMAVFGGTAPLVSTWLQSWTKMSVAPAAYIMLAAGVGFFVLSYVRGLSNGMSTNGR